MTETDTSREAVRLMLKGIGSTPFPGDLQNIADDAVLMIAALQAERDTAWNDAIEEAANSVKSHAETARRRLREAYDLGAERKVVDGWSAIISHMDNEADTIRAIRKGEPT